MKANEILKAITNGVGGAQQKAHCKQLADIYSLIKQLKKDVMSVTVESCEFNFGKKVERQRWNDEPRIIDGEKMPGERFIVKTSFGTYSQVIPINNDFYVAFAGLLSEFVKVQAIPAIKPDFEIAFSKKHSKVIFAAAKFCSNDSLRPAMQNVQIEIKEFGLVNVVATDGTRLYFEQFFEPTLTDLTTLLLPANELKKAKQNGPLNIELFNNATGKINGTRFDQCTERFPNYLAVWPDYKEYVELHREDLINAIKVVLPFANKTTHQLRCYFNGSVQISAEDLDFCNESNVKVGYWKKTTQDFEIGFNGKLLLDCLQVSKETKLRIYSNGNPKQAVLIDDTSLLMPVMLNQYV